MAGTWLALGAVLAVIIQGSSDDSRSAGITWGTYDTIRSANVDGSAQHVLVPPIADNQGDPAWTRDGHMLALFGRNSDSSWIFAFSPQSHKLRRLGPRSAARGYEPTWSPDAKRVAFAEDWGPYYGEPREATIKILSLATNKRTLVTRPQYNRIDSEPAWSPDAQTIVFVRQRLYGTQTIYLTHPDGSETRALTMGSSASPLHSVIASTASAPMGVRACGSSADWWSRSFAGPPTDVRSSTRPATAPTPTCGSQTSTVRIGGAWSTISPSKGSPGDPRFARRCRTGRRGSVERPSRPVGRPVIHSGPDYSSASSATPTPMS